MSSADDEILQSFIDETREHLADIENDLLAIEEAGADIDEDLVNKVLRAAHSVKGGAGFMGLDTIRDLSHKIENVLGMIRNSEIIPDSEVVNILLLAFDKLRDMINNVQDSNETDISEHVVALNGIKAAYLPEATKNEVTERVDIALPDGSVMFSLPRFDVSHAIGAHQKVYLVEYDMIHDIHRHGMTPLEFLTRLQTYATIIDCRVEVTLVGTLSEEEIINRIPLFALLAVDAQMNTAAVLGVDAGQIHAWEDLSVQTAKEPDTYDILSPPEQWTDHSKNQAEASTIPPSTPVDPRESLEQAPATAVSEPTAKPKARPSSTGKNAPAETTLRVSIKVLDTLMNLAGELVLSRNELVQAVAANETNLAASAAQRINLVTSELQEAIMLTRMQPIGNIFNKFPRVVRDLASTLGKKIELSVSGKDVELDKTINEGIADPLTHLVRNSADHGIEEVAVRRELGKNETGQIWLKAYHSAGHVNIEISDDGKGIDPEKLAESAMAKGLISSAQAQEMSDKEKMALIFMPGFSMAQKVTDVSGRGVGMDVVKTNLDKLGGQIDVESQLGKGTTIRIKLPLTLAIIPSLMISSRGHRYALPMVNVLELLRIPADQIAERIEKVGDAEVVRLRQELLPTVNLHDILDCDPPPSSDEHSPPDASETTLKGQAMNIVVVSAGSFKYGLIVDKLHDSEEIVVKPLDHHLKKCKGYAGATIMGNGQVALILDVASLAGMAELNIDIEAAKGTREADSQGSAQSMDTESLLVFGSSENERFGVSVDLVGRIEKIAATDVETIGGKKTIKYRGGVLPVYAIDDVANVEALAARKDLLVIVFEGLGHAFGVLAIPPIDTVNTVLDLDDRTLKQVGIEGSTIIDNQTILIVDIFEMIKALNPQAMQGSQTGQGPHVEAKQGMKKILYAEDSGFFRNTVKKYLEDDGFCVLDAGNGQKAWDLLDENADDVAVVLTDMEMPVLDGLGLTKRARQDERFKDIPIIALTTLAGEKDVQQGLAAGITDYQIKIDKDGLLASVHTIMERYG
jgi:two-component system chemotaxis sensor kinase CheA